MFPDPTQIVGHNAAIPALGLSNKIIDNGNIRDKNNLAAGNAMNGDCTFVKGSPTNSPF